MTPTEAKIEEVLALLTELGLSPVEFIISLIKIPRWSYFESKLYNALDKHWQSHQSIRDYITNELTSEILSMVNRKEDFEFVAATANEERMQRITISSLASKMSSSAPHLWKLLDHLFSADQYINRKRELKRQHSSQFNPFNNASDSILDHHNRDKLIPVKKVVCISMMLQSTNQRSNALQSIIGVFLHSCGTPETVREFLAHAGLSIAPRGIDSCITSLSKEANKKIRSLGQSFNALFAYDNLDVDLKHAAPSLEKSGATLAHLTTALMMPLGHGTSEKDLHCAEEVWKTSIRDQSSHAEKILPQITSTQLFESVHPDPGHPSGLSRHGLFIEWKILKDIVEGGPDYFRTFRSRLTEPEVILGIPASMTSQVPMYAMDIKPDTPANNASVLEQIFEQAGIGDSKDNLHVHDIGNHVILMFGDLLTGQHLHSLQESRVLEGTAGRQLQPIVFNMGLFHLKMACADAIWKTCIVPLKARDDPTSLMAFVKQLRPKETIKMETSPGFRRMHEVIQQVGLLLRLDIWRQKFIEKGYGSSLEEAAEQEIQWDDLTLWARELAHHFQAMSDMSALRNRAKKDRDEQQENILLMHDYFFWYEEMSYALNEGDIGRVETLFMPWMYIFRGCGKHKYAAELQRYLENMFFHYPEGLRKTVRMNILCNPTGRKGAFRAIDWVVEHNNLYIKRIYGGKFSNHTKQRILEESALIGVYKDLRIQIEEMFYLDCKMFKHSGPEMTSTYRKVLEYVKDVKANEYVAGRVSAHILSDAMAKGMSTAHKKKKIWTRINENLMDVDEPEDQEGTNNLGADIEEDDILD